MYENGVIDYNQMRIVAGARHLTSDEFDEIFIQTSNADEAEQFEEAEDALKRATEMAANSGANKIFHIWTVVDGDGDSLIVQNGWHACNRLYYIVTERPWNPGDDNHADYLDEYIEAEY